MTELDLRRVEDRLREADPTSERPSSREGIFTRYAWLARGAIVVLGVVVFELTANAALSTAMCCLEFGRHDFVTARWLRRNDPDYHRGRLCSAGHLAWACWRAFLVSLTLIVVDLLLAGGWPRGPRFGAKELSFALAFSMMGWAFILASLLAAGVVLKSLLTGKRFWLGSEPGRARLLNIWPPSAVGGPHGRSNWGKTLVYLAVCFPIGYPLLMLLMVAASSLDMASRRALLLGFLLVFLPLVFFVLASHLKRRVLAASPGDCWPLDEVGATSIAR